MLVGKARIQHAGFFVTLKPVATFRAYHLFDAAK